MIMRKAVHAFPGGDDSVNQLPTKRRLVTLLHNGKRDAKLGALRNAAVDAASGKYDGSHVYI